MRYTDLKFPDYAHRPGKTYHPNKKGGHSYGRPEPKDEPLSEHNFESHQLFLFGIDLYNHEYFWEAHVYWESCWHELNRVGEEADVLKSLILLSAGRLKQVLGQSKPASIHWQRSIELLKTLNSSFLLGINLNKLSDEISELNRYLKSCDAISHVLELDR